MTKGKSWKTDKQCGSTNGCGPPVFSKPAPLAQKHIELGRVLVNGAKVKNSKNIAAGDVLHLTLNSLPYEITVQALNHQRRPAPEARLLYRENEEVAAKREQQKLLDQASRISAAYPRRPSDQA